MADLLVTAHAVEQLVLRAAPELGLDSAKKASAWLAERVKARWLKRRNMLDGELPRVLVPLEDGLCALLRDSLEVPGALAVLTVLTVGMVAQSFGQGRYRWVPRPNTAAKTGSKWSGAKVVVSVLMEDGTERRLIVRAERADEAVQAMQTMPGVRPESVRTIPLRSMEVADGRVAP